jgi:uncharacterized protein (DUF58 family)
LSPTALRSDAEALAAPLPPLLAQAERLSASVLPGEHGRRRAGTGDAFWQFRPAIPGDSARSIDWRRSARSDATFVRETEWQASQAVTLWVDGSRSMEFASADALPSKGARARLLGLALAVLLVRGGERVGLFGGDVPPRSGRAQLDRIAAALSEPAGADYGAPGDAVPPAGSRALFLSDFLGDPGPAEAALARAADRDVRGALVQVLDPAEVAFPFRGRTVFESMGGGLRHETLHAGELRRRYLDRLGERRDRLEGLARRTGWLHLEHHTDAPPAPMLLTLFAALERGR